MPVAGIIEGHFDSAIAYQDTAVATGVGRVVVCCSCRHCCQQDYDNTKDGTTTATVATAIFVVATNTVATMAAIARLPQLLTRVLLLRFLPLELDLIQALLF